MRRPRRVCLPSKEREDYVLFSRKQGHTLVTERQKNRYIDEFLRYCSDQFGHTDALKISQSNLIRYARHVERMNRNSATAYAKLGAVFTWFHWLAKTKRIENDPAEGLNASRMASNLEP